MNEQLEIRTLGGLAVTRNGEPVTAFDSKKVAALLIYLACTGRTQPREVLAELFWEGRTQSQSLANLRVALTSLRQTVGGFVTITRETVGLNEDSAIWLDVSAFEEALSAGELEQAVDLYQGDFLAGFTVDSPAFEDWTILERERLRFAAMGALDALIARCLEAGDSTAGITQATQLLQMDPLREETHRQLMLLLTQSGQRRAALAQYEKLTSLLRDELGVQPMPDTVALYEQIQAGEIIQVASSTPLGQSSESTARPRHNLPRQATSFVGREPEIQAILAQLENPDCHLLTLVGPGGIGKTRLALAVAERLLGHFTNGVFFVELAPLRDPDGMVSTIATAVGFQFYQSPDSAEQQLLNYLREKEMLLVLDNFEHLLEGVTLVDAILATAPGVTILATSREALQIGWEWLFEVGGMHYPQNGDVEAAPDDYSALRLFAERARRIQPGFALREQRACAVRVCELVGGMPLGIELATGWLRALPCEALVREIESSLDILATKQRDLPDRHRSIQAVFESSWRRLSEVERTAFMKLSVFQGGFTPEAAEQVAGATLHIRMALLNKSLLRRDPDTERYAMHELVRQYAARQLAAHPDQYAQARDDHCTFYADLIHGLEDDLESARHQAAQALIAVESDNGQAAWEWAVRRGKVEDLGKMMVAWGHWWGDQRDRREKAYREAADMLAMADLSGDQAAILGKALVRQGIATASIMERKELLAKGLAILRPVGTQKEVALALWWQSMVAQNQGDYELSLERLHESLAAYQEAASKRGVASALTQMGWIAGNFLEMTDEARLWLQQSLEIFEELGDLTSISQALIVLGVVSEPELKVELFQQSLSIRRQIGDRRGEAVALINLGWEDYLAGAYAEAATYFQEGLAIQREYGDASFGISAALINLGHTTYAQGNHQAASRYFSEALQVFKEFWDARGAKEIVVGVARLLAALKRPGRAVELLAVVSKPPGHVDNDVKKMVESLYKDLETSLPPEDFAAAWKHGESLDLKTVVEQLHADLKDAS